jgi:uncharacterized protein (DUF2267 family)
MALNFQKYVDEGNRFINRLAEALGNASDKDHASRVSVAVLHAIRDRIKPEESMHLIAQLPMMLKAVYVDGWNITREPADAKTIEEFLNEVREHAPRSAARDFGNDQQARDNVKAFFSVLRGYVDEGEMADLCAQLPAGVRELIVDHA